MKKRGQPKRTRAKKTCGSCYAGILLMQDGIGDQEVIERCDECGLFETDDDAVNAVRHLLELLHEEYETGDDETTVADAHDDIVERTRKLRPLPFVPDSTPLTTIARVLKDSPMSSGGVQLQQTAKELRAELEVAQAELQEGYEAAGDPDNLYARPLFAVQHALALIGKEEP